VHQNTTHPMTTAPAKLVCNDVWKIFGRAPERVYHDIVNDTADVVAQSDHVIAVRGVSFEVQRGETFVVMGLSGSGKSTLVRCISRLTDPTHGAILVNGQDVLTMNERELRELRRNTVSMVFQNFGLLPHRSVIDNAAYGLEVRGVPRRERLARAQEMIELVGLKGWEQRLPKQLSGGMQQRVGLARALAVDPEILLFDEPFSALDPLIRREMQDELLRLQSTLHKTSVFITHDFAEALKIGDRIAIMRHGQLVQVGTPAELVLNPRNEYVQAFVKDAPRARVLTVGAIMTPCAPLPVGDEIQRVRADDPVETLLPILAASDQMLAVAAENTVVGHVDRTALLRALCQE
jgi:glycine betaine/proline transport system ATP-binding protein